ncbi:MAG: hypothetical protein JSV68_16145 [Anaerolineaceae bacterium]|nr:MAG: hypothetical protein JSV68_16145 [Anaerolineaceae bacterium]
MMTLPIRSERVRLRRFTEADVKDVVDFVAHPSVARVTPEIEATKRGYGSILKCKMVTGCLSKINVSTWRLSGSLTAR